MFTDKIKKLGDALAKRGFNVDIEPAPVMPFSDERRSLYVIMRNNHGVNTFNVKQYSDGSVEYFRVYG
ncbi:hypothetical protein Makalu002_217 [Escherichia phage Ec_Makalu_002]|uniref:Uncharacterized protein n=1 Tax=Escherichia phage Ec_Makalu_002 TaxID=2682770 RepID=A0A650DG84_9CAUD|nr:hypothetical protein Makalu002_217 [Escherichia phage Ec_Makalu_002]